MLLLSRPLRSWVPRVPEGIAVGTPGKAATGGRKLQPGYDLSDLFTAGDVENMNRAIFASIVGHRNREERAVRRWHKPVNGCCALRINDIGIDHNSRPGWIRSIGQDGNHRLLLGRLGKQREYLVAYGVQRGIGTRRCRYLFHQPVEDRLTEHQAVKIFPRALVLRSAPLVNLLIVRFFKPAIRIGNGNVVIGISNLVLWSRRSPRIAGLRANAACEDATHRDSDDLASHANHHSHEYSSMLYFSPEVIAAKE